MSETLLIDKNVYVEYQISPIARYNIFIKCYNTPNNIVNQIPLDSLPESNLYNTICSWLYKLRGKIAFLLLALVPIVDVFLVAVAIYCNYLYFSSLKVHQENTKKVIDPFKHMIFDPQLCFTLKRDYYFFNIEFKDLQGFTLNYNQEMKKQLHLRRQRGKASFMIYNANFWAHYHQLGKWKILHWGSLVLVTILAIASNTCLFLFIFL